MALPVSRGGAVQRSQPAGGGGLVEILDRILDKGIVIDAWVRISLVGIELITIEARVVVASVETYLRYADAIGATLLAAPPSVVDEAASTTAESQPPPAPIFPPEEQVMRR